MSVIKCSHCGKDLPSEAKFCPYCMERISETVIVKLPAKKKKLNKKSIIIIIIALVLVLLLAVGTALFSHFSRKDDSNNGIGDTQSTNSTESTSLNNSTAENEPSISEDDDASKVISIKDAFSIVNDKKDEDVSTQSNNSTSTTSSTTTDKNNSVSECEHNWVAITKTVHHDEVGHYETVENQRKVTKYKCPVCYEKFTSLDEYYSHFDSTHKPSYDGDPIKALRNQYTTESGYEYYETKEWIVDKKAYDETVVTGYKCSICQEEKE